MHVAIPYSMIEPIRDVLDAGVQSDVDDVDERWITALQNDIMDTTIPINAVLAKKYFAREVADLKSGDVIPVEVPDVFTVTANGVPVLRARLGSLNENLAFRLKARLTCKGVHKLSKI